MLWWRRKTDGFEWHKYVRTTIKLKREDRRARMMDAREVAADGLRYAGRASVAAGNRGAASLWALAMRGLGAVASAIGAGAANAWGLTTGRVVPALRHAAASAAGALRRGIAGLVTGVAEALPNFGALAPAQRRTIAAAIVAVVAGGAGFVLLKPGLKAVGGLAGMNPFAARVIEGKASVVSGDTMRFERDTVRLSGIEAPALDQKCGAGKKRWACGEAAQAALQKLVRGKAVRCEVSGRDDNNVTLAACSIGADARDLAEALVREGAVFAEAGMFATYAAVEDEAKEKKLGLWKAEAERPAEYRTRLWEEAAKAAPDGCPIKGQISGDNRTYLVPWHPRYGAARLRPTRGERWFCSETEAQAAGWVVAAR